MAQAVCDYVNKINNKNHRVKMAVGYDTRFLSDKYAEIIARVLAANGIKALLSKSFIPTPALSLAAGRQGLSGGIMVTASHNPAEFNGIKFKTNMGSSAGPEITEKIEAYIGKNKVKSLPFKTAVTKGLIEETDNLSAYKKNIRSFLDMKALNRCKLNVLIDSMHGASNAIILDILKSSGINVTILREKPRADFGNVPPEPIAKNLKQLTSLMKEGEYDIGLATDGDGDRLAVIAPGGRFITSSEVFGLLIIYFTRCKNESVAIGKTISSSDLINKICESYNLNLIETPIGFKYLANLMINEKVSLAGEESGGIGIRNYLPDRDGLLIQLLLLEMLSKTGKSIVELLGEMKKNFGKFYYQRADFKFPGQTREKLKSKIKNYRSETIANKKIKEIKKIDGIKFILDDGSWLLFRFSGTEPVLRIYAESNTKKSTSAMINFAAKLIK
ncbi:MAG: phosphoglucomutase/phosphomannomutase family protein [Candidatus Omnitrophica bacterium]|nr:phosphoglucomutase/phosphomannomutase family protein [Candidatus Omnitrophota bacterium]